MAIAGGLLGALGSVVGAVAPLLLSKGNDAPSAPPPAPPPTVSDAADAKDVGAAEPVLDSEAARQRAIQRRQGEEQRRLFKLNDDEDETVITKSLLGGD